MKNRITIRMGASAWDATVNHNGQEVNFDFHKLTRDERAAFHRELMNAFRTNYYGDKPQEKARPKAQSRRRYQSRSRKAA